MLLACLVPLHDCIIQIIRLNNHLLDEKQPISCIELSTKSPKFEQSYQQLFHTFNSSIWIIRSISKELHPLFQVNYCIFYWGGGGGGHSVSPCCNYTVLRSTLCLN